MLHVCHYRLRYWNAFFCDFLGNFLCLVTCMSLPLAVLKHGDIRDRHSTWWLHVCHYRLRYWNGFCQRNYNFQSRVTCMSLPLAVLKLSIMSLWIAADDELHVCHYRLRYWNASNAGARGQLCPVTCMSLPLAVLKPPPTLFAQRRIKCAGYMYVITACGIETGNVEPLCITDETCSYMYVITACGIET